MLSNLLKLFLLLIIATSMNSCKREGCTDPLAINYSEKAKKDDGSCIYDNSKFQGEMLNDIGNGIILLRYEKAKTLADNLNNSIIQFSDSPSTTLLTQVRSNLLAAELAWQKCAMFEFGPAESMSLRSNINTFPTDTVQMEEKISTGIYDLSSFLSTGYKGFPALDYLLWSAPSDSIVGAFQNSTQRINFLKAVSARIKTELDLVYNKWSPAGDNYLNTFTTTTGTDVSSSLSLLVNQFNYEYELLKNAKLGIPLGKQTLGTAYPKQCEAYYAGNSAELAKACFNGLYDVYTGKTELGEDKKGLLDYLVVLENEGLSSQINTSFQTAINKLAAVPDPMSNTIVSNPGIIDIAYEEIKKLIVSIKTDMTTEMEVTITYKDGDGD